MDYLASPAWLGGIMACIALSAWTVGRWQGAAALTRETPGAPSPSYSPPRLAPSREPLATVATLPRHTDAETERQGALGQTDSLTDLHAEVSAYRRQERIFALLADDAFRVDQSRTGEGADGRFMEPTLTVHSARIAPIAEPAPQPSLGCGPFTLV